MRWQKKQERNRTVHLARSADGRARYKIYKARGGWLVQISRGTSSRTSGPFKTLKEAKASAVPKKYPDPYASVGKSERARLRSALKDV